MTDSYQTYLEVLDRTNKEENGYLPADLFNRFAVTASRFVFNDYQSRLQNPDTAIREKQKLMDRLTPFIQREDIVVEKGYAAVPTNYAYFSNGKAYFDNGDSLIQLNALYSKICMAEEDPSINVFEVTDQIEKIINNPKMTAVQLLDNEQICKRLNSYIPGKRPSMKKPVMEREGGRFHLYPESEASLFLWYYRRPVPAKLVLREDPSTLGLVYDMAASVPFEWNDEAMNDIVGHIRESFYEYIRDAQGFQMRQVTKEP